MTRRINLMSEAARFNSTARRHVWRWLIALGAMTTVLTLLAIVRWAELRQIRNEHEAMEASYEPIRRLIALNRDLRAEGVALVRDDHLALELSPSRPVSVLLGAISSAAAASGGELYIEHLGISQSLPGEAGGANPGVAKTPSSASASEQRLVLEAAATLSYDIARFVEALQKTPISSVKVTSDVVVSQNGVDRKNYIIECLF